MCRNSSCCRCTRQPDHAKTLLHLWDNVTINRSIPLPPAALHNRPERSRWIIHSIPCRRMWNKDTRAETHRRHRLQQYFCSITWDQKHNEYLLISQKIYCIYMADACSCVKHKLASFPLISQKANLLIVRHVITDICSGKWQKYWERAAVYLNLQLQTESRTCDRIKNLKSQSAVKLRLLTCQSNTAVELKDLGGKKYNSNLSDKNRKTEWMNAWTNEWVNAWMNEYMN